MDVDDLTRTHQVATCLFSIGHQWLLSFILVASVLILFAFSTNLVATYSHDIDKNLPKFVFSVTEFDTICTACSKGSAQGIKV